jgi:anti-sigma B factor antagonist
VSRVQVTIGSAGQAVVVRVAGDVDSETADSVERTLRDQLADATVLIVDLLGVDFLASAGLNALVLVHRQALTDDVPFAVVADQNAVLRPITVLGLDQALTVCPSIAQAQADLAR